MFFFFKNRKSYFVNIQHKNFLRHIYIEENYYRFHYSFLPKCIRTMDGLGYITTNMQFYNSFRPTLKAFFGYFIMVIRNKIKIYKFENNFAVQSYCKFFGFEQGTTSFKYNTNVVKDIQITTTCPRITINVAECKIGFIRYSKKLFYFSYLKNICYFIQRPKTEIIIANSIYCQTSKIFEINCDKESIIIDFVCYKPVKQDCVPNQLVDKSLCLKNNMTLFEFRSLNFNELIFFLSKKFPEYIFPLS